MNDAMALRPSVAPYGCKRHAPTHRRTVRRRGGTRPRADQDPPKGEKRHHKHETVIEDHESCERRQFLFVDSSARMKLKKEVVWQ